MPLFESITDIDAQSERIRARRYGVIECAQGRFLRITFRPWPKLVSVRDLRLVDDNYHERGPADRCRLYFNQPLRHSRYLALKYVATTHGASYRTFVAALRTLDHVALIKQSDALLCDAANSRLTDRFLARMGWQPHAPMPWRRNFIKRFNERRPGATTSRPGMTNGVCV